MKSLLILFLTILAMPAIGQNISISNEKMKLLYAEIDNPLNAVVENLPCNSFFLTTDNGTINGNECLFNINPSDIGVATIVVKQKRENDTIIIGKSKFRVKEIPRPIAKIANMHGGNIGKNELAAQLLIFPELEIELQIHIEITSYSSTVIHNGQVIYSENNKSGNLSASLKSAINSLAPKDQILFYNIYAKWPSARTEVLEPMIFTVK